MKLSLFRSRAPQLAAVALTSLALTTAPALHAQANTGQLTGTVADSSGALIPNASIQITNPQTGLTRSAKTDGSGNYTLQALPVGTYEETIDSPGFSSYKEQVTISVGGHATVDAKLSAGSTASVEVTGKDEATQVNTTNSEISQVVSGPQLLDLPSLTRNPYDFVALSGNVTTDPNNTQNRGVGGSSLNGQRASGTEILLDGVENANSYAASVGQSIPLDSVSQYRIITNGFDAQYGRAAGGVVNLVTKSGSNTFHGSLYEYNRVSALAANTYNEDAQNFANRAAGLPNNPADHFTRNQFGYSVGGPVLRNKLFFFSNTEWNRIRSIGSVPFEVPSAAFIAGSAANTQAYFQSFGAIAPTTRLGATIPVAGYTGPNPLQAATATLPFDAGAEFPRNEWSTLNRFDVTINSKSTAYFRAGDFQDVYQAGFNSFSPYAAFNTGQNDFNQSYLFDYTYVFTPTLISDSKVSFARINTNQPINGPNLVPGLYLNQSNTQSTDPATNQAIALPGYLPTSPGNALPFGGPANTYQFLEDLIYSRGNHTLHFGGSFLQIRDNRTFGASENATQVVSRNGTAIGTALAALQAGNIYSFAVAVDPQGKLPCFFNPNGSVNVTPGCSLTLPASSPNFERQNTFNDGDWYAEDTWKLAPTLTVDLGIRWEYYGVQHNHNPNLESNFFIGQGANLPAQIASGQIATTPNSPVGGLVAQRFNNYAPRIGFSYDPTGNGKWAVRGGYGISYERNFGNVTYNVIQNPPNYAGVTLTSSATVQNRVQTTNFGPFAGNTGAVPLTSPSLRALQQNMPTAYTENFSFSVQHELATNDLLSIEYSGAHGVNQYAIANVNGIGFGTLTGNVAPTTADNFGLNRLNHQYGAINLREANGRSHYNALNVRFNANNLQQRGLVVTANYTLSHALDNLSSTFSESGGNFNLGYLNPFNPNLDYGNADFDVRHRLSVSALWEPTFLEFRSNRALHTVLGGLQFAPIATLRTGTPFTIYDCTNAVNNCPRIVGAPGLRFHGTPVANGGVNSYNYINIPTASANTFTNSQGYSDVPDSLGGFQNPGLARNQFYEPNNYLFNIGVYKNFHFGSDNRYTVQLRSEFYNALNHHNFYAVVGTADFSQESVVGAIKGSQTGTPNSADERRNTQLALRFEF